MNFVSNVDIKDEREIQNMSVQRGEHDRFSEIYSFDLVDLLMDEQFLCYIEEDVKLRSKNHFKL